jgi:cellulose synthase/poly-beta-1,6-N-acetylglucosamine synthase-like glycosyltransferase
MFDIAVEMAFWGSVLGLAYSYALYPLILLFWQAIRTYRRAGPPPEISLRADRLPRVSVVIAAYNEEAVIGGKMENLRILDYPSDRIEFLVGSDGSTDATEHLVRASGVVSLHVYGFSERRGKAAVLNDLVAKAGGEIVVFSDANTVYEPDAIRYLAGAFADPTVGGVLGELSLVSAEDRLAERAESLYWRYENALKRLESSIQTTLGGNGPLYAIRRSLFVPLPNSKVVTDDLLVPLSVIAGGYRVVFEPRARAAEETSGSVAEEFRRKTRIAAGNFYGVSEFYRLLSPFHGFAAFALWSHKMIRWMGWVFLLAIAGSSAYLAKDSEFFYAVCLLELVVAGLLVLGAAAERVRVRIGLLGMPFHFLAMNAALALGFVWFILGRRNPAWKVLRHKRQGT